MNWARTASALLPVTMLALALLDCKLFDKSYEQITYERVQSCRATIDACGRGNDERCLAACEAGDEASCARHGASSAPDKSALTAAVGSCSALTAASCGPVAAALEARGDRTAAAFAEHRGCVRSVPALCVRGARRALAGGPDALGPEVGLHLAALGCVYGAADGCRLVRESDAAVRPAWLTDELVDRLRAHEHSIVGLAPAPCADASVAWRTAVEAARKLVPPTPGRKLPCPSEGEPACNAQACLLGERGACGGLAAVGDTSPLAHFSRFRGCELGDEALCERKQHRKSRPAVRRAPGDDFEACIEDGDEAACDRHLPRVHLWARARDACRAGSKRACAIYDTQRLALNAAVRRQGGTSPSPSRPPAASAPRPSNDFVLWVRASVSPLPQANMKTIIFRPIWAPRAATRGDICQEIGCDQFYDDVWLVRRNYDDEVMKYWHENKRIVGGLGFVGVSKLEAFVMCEPPFHWILGCP